MLASGEGKESSLHEYGPWWVTCNPVEKSKNIWAVQLAFYSFLNYLLYIYFFIVYVCIILRAHMLYTHARFCREKRARDALELKLQTVKAAMWVLGIQWSSSEWAATALAPDPSLQPHWCISKEREQVWYQGKGSWIQEELKEKGGYDQNSRLKFPKN